MTLRILAAILAVLLLERMQSGRGQFGRAAAGRAQQGCDGRVLRHEPARTSRTERPDHHRKPDRPVLVHLRARHGGIHADARPTPRHPRDLRVGHGACAKLGRAGSDELGRRPQGVLRDREPQARRHGRLPRPCRSAIAPPPTPLPPPTAARSSRSRRFRARTCWAATPPASQTENDRSEPANELRGSPMPNANLTRRRMIAIVAAAAGSALLGGSRFARASVPVRWRGSALGAQVSIEIFHSDRAEAEQIGRSFACRMSGVSSSSSACTGPIRRSARSTVPAFLLPPMPTWCRCSRPRCSFPI